MLRNFPESFEALFFSSKQRGRERKGPPEIIQKFRQKQADFECRFPYESYGRDRAPFWPFLGEGFWGKIWRPLVLPAPFVLLLKFVGQKNSRHISRQISLPKIKKHHRRASARVQGQRFGPSVPSFRFSGEFQVTVLRRYGFSILKT